LQWINNKNVEFVGFVNDYTEFFNKADFFISPLLIGGGIIVKILQAMHAGIPVLTNKYGNEGINAPDNCIIICNSPQEYAEKLISLLKNKSEYSYLSENSKKFIKDNFSHDKIKEILYNRFENLT
jgi:glycosyltransferase involved in cell wall biosynthesis